MAWKKEIQGGEGGGGAKRHLGWNRNRKDQCYQNERDKLFSLFKVQIYRAVLLAQPRAHWYRSTRPSFPFSINPLAFDRSTKSSNL